MSKPAARIAAGLLAVGLLGAAWASPARARVDVPIDEVRLSDGNLRYTVPISVGGGPPVTAMLDTGSFGLRVLAGAVEAGRYERTDTRRSFGFGGGVRLEGALARAPLGVGAATTSEPALFQVVDRVGCTERRPDCPAARLAPADYRIGGDGLPREGFQAILGISMRRAAVADSTANPLDLVGSASWIVVLPRPGSGEPGHLIVDPDPDERRGFDTVRLERAGGDIGGAHGWADGALPGCLAIPARRARYCGKTILDTGAPGFAADAEGVARPAPLGAGEAATLTIDAGGAPLSIAFTSGGDPSRRVVLRPAEGEARLSAGTLPFFSYAVLYDAAAGTVGFKPRD